MNNNQLAIVCRATKPVKLGDYFSVAVTISLIMFAARMVHVPFEQMPLVVIIIDVGHDTVNLLLSALVHFVM